MIENALVRNPFKPGAGHMPPFLAGREAETQEFRKLLNQEIILENLILTGLRGLGKTVLLEQFKPMAIQAGWLWAGTDLSESTSISEENLATRLLTDLSLVTSSFVTSVHESRASGFGGTVRLSPETISFQALVAKFQNTPGLIQDKLKATLEYVAPYVKSAGYRGIIFAYDEAQNLTDHAVRNQYPLSLLLDTFQSLQRKGIPFMLALTGLPTLFPKLVEARTYAERMFHLIFLDPLDQEETSQAIRKPIQDSKNCPFTFADESVQRIWQVTKGYPYFVQYVCREIFDVWVQAANAGEEPPPIPEPEIMRKLDADFFAGRWARATDRQRDLLRIIAQLENCEAEFTVQEIVEQSSNRKAQKPFSSSHVNQMLGTLADAGLIYKNRYGKYSFAVPLLSAFILRQVG